MLAGRFYRKNDVSMLASFIKGRSQTAAINRSLRIFQSWSAFLLGKSDQHTSLGTKLAIILSVIKFLHLSEESDVLECFRKFSDNERYSCGKRQ